MRIKREADRDERENEGRQRDKYTERRRQTEGGHTEPLDGVGDHQKVNHG